MTTTEQGGIGSEIGRRLLRAAIATLGLIVIRFVLVKLLDHAPAIQVGGNAPPEGVPFDWQRIMEEIVKGGRVPESIRWGGGQFALPFILPAWIAGAIVDTLIFAVLILTAAGFKRMIRERSTRLPEGGVMVMLVVLAAVVALAHHSYRGVIPPLLGTYAKWYPWFFLALGLLPLIGFVIVGARNLDAITELVLGLAKQKTAGTAGAASASRDQGAVAGPSQKRASNAPASSPAASPGTACPKCGSALAAGTKFCAVCGAAAPGPENTEPTCPGCGAKQERGAKFCEHCGQALQLKGAVV